MAYAFDRLGFLQFEQLCAALFELEGQIPADAWLGEADRCRSVLSGAQLGRPLVRSGMPAPVLVQCAWVRGGQERRLLEAVGLLCNHRVHTRPQLRESERRLGARRGDAAFCTRCDVRSASRGSRRTSVCRTALAYDRATWSARGAPPARPLGSSQSS